MIYKRVHESNQAELDALSKYSDCKDRKEVHDRFIKTTPKNKTLNSKEVGLRATIWDDMTKEEKHQALLKMFPHTDTQDQQISKYYNINNNSSVKSKGNNIIPNKSKFRESTKLHGQDADNFLESIGVSINMDNSTITIGEFTMDGYLGQTILAENGIILNDDYIIVNK